jgi:hypothetical protein
MGYYVNPLSETNEDFLGRVGQKLDAPMKWEDIPADHLPVQLIDIGWTTAAVIGYSKAEYKYFQDPLDTRPKTDYLVKIEDLIPVADPPSFAVAINQAV